MISNISVPTVGMPSWLQVLADWNPLSAIATAARTLFGNPSAPTNGAGPLEHPVLATLAWTAILLAVFMPLCSRRYARPASKGSDPQRHLKHARKQNGNR